MSYDPQRAVEMTPVVSEVAADFGSGSGLPTPGCVCGHEGLGPDWHSSSCPTVGKMWREKALELARRLDQERSLSVRLRSPAARRAAARAQIALDTKLGRPTPHWVRDIAETGHTEPR